jgi:spore coat assembly protein
MLFNIGDVVTRISHDNDTYFEILDINGDTAYLKGINIRLEADSLLSDLVKVEKGDIIDDEAITDGIANSFKLDRDEFFYLPGKILHIDADEDYLKRCMNFYKRLNVMAYGVCLKENEISSEITSYLEELNPDIVIITGHDAYYKKKGKELDINNYKNTKNFINAVKIAREYEKNQDKLIIIAGACQSNYEELIKAGATYASSPKRINIHALDPAIIASYVALYDRNKVVDLIEVLSKTKYGSDGIGGVATKGCMFVGYPR